MKTTQYRLNRKSFSVGDTCFVLLKGTKLRRFDEPKVIECVVKKIGKESISVAEKNGGRGFSFNFADGFSYLDPDCGSSRWAELFKSMDELFSRNEYVRLHYEIADYFNDNDPYTLFDQGPEYYDLEAARIIFSLIDPDSGKDLARFLTQCIQQREKLIAEKGAEDKNSNEAMVRKESNQ